MATLIDRALDRKADRLEGRIMKLKRQLAKLRRGGKRRKVKEYAFRDSDGKKLSLSQAFGDKDDLIVVHNMGRRCPYCTMWGDEYNGARRHIENRAAFLVVSPDEPKVQNEFRKSRGWTFRMASAAGTTFNRDMGFEPKPGWVAPGFTTFHRRGKDILRVSRRFFGPGDDFCGVWHFFDLLADGAGEWQPRLQY
jgi:predicted dithiol-disulfide oxidoreductase (DUF899 family)